MAARWSSENVVVEFRDTQVFIVCARLKPHLLKLTTVNRRGQFHPEYPQGWSPEYF